MDITEISNIIGTLGFPIIMCLLIYKQNGELTKSHKEEIDSLSNVINNNTLTLEKLSYMLERGGSNESSDS